MEPTLSPGDRLLVLPVLRLRPGQIVAVADPRHPAHLLVKRITSVDRRSKTVVVEGDNQDESTDSRAFGPVRSRAVVGRVAYRYAPVPRAGPIGGGR